MWRKYELRGCEYARLDSRLAELRVDDPDGPVLTGYAALFDVESVDLGGFREVIRKGAFTKTLRESPDIRMLWNHDTSYVLGRTAAGTLRLEEDEKGLRFECRPNLEPPFGAFVESIRRGDVSQCSFGFSVVKDVMNSREDNEPDLRELLEVKLYEVSPVAFPAYEGTTVTGRSIRRELLTEIERMLPPGDLPAETARGVLEAIGRCLAVEGDEEPPFDLEGDRIAIRRLELEALGLEVDVR